MTVTMIAVGSCCDGYSGVDGCKETNTSSATACLALPGPKAKAAGVTHMSIAAQAARRGASTAGSSVKP